MLRWMRIRDFALIREIEIEFGAGLTLLTGETGSGKSILVDALALLVGERASLEMIRTGCDQAVLEGVFALEPAARRRLAGSLGKVLQGAGIDPESVEELIIRREISSGRNRVYVNSNLATLAFLKSLGDELADIHGQHEHQALLDAGSHVDFLDLYGGNSSAAAEVAAAYRRLEVATTELDALALDERERLRRIDALQYQVDEIRRAALRAGEREELENERRVLANRERIFALASEAYSLLYDSEHAILGQSNRVARVLGELERLDARWGAYQAHVSESLFRLEDLAYFARDYTTGIDFSPERLDSVEGRLSDLERLTRKYGHSVEGVLQYCEACAVELESLMLHEERVAARAAARDSLTTDYLARAEKLSGKRRRDARQLEREIRKELSAISMEQTEFVVRFAPRVPGEGAGLAPGDGPRGIDRIEFLVSPNRGEEPKPLARIASGGEISRIVLALKSLCGGDEAGKTLVFDEVDAGIGGRVAEAVGRRLLQISRANQVLCVTHLPQIAAFATRHYRVRKEAVGARTETSVELLGDGERSEELARMLGGETITETTRAAAREMLAHSSGEE